MANGETKTCPHNSDFPLEVVYAEGSNWEDGTLVVCGGYKGGYISTSQCYTLKNGKWQLNNGNNLQTARNSHGASVTANAIWFTGGDDGTVVFF